MPISFKPVPTGTLDVSTGKTTGLAQKQPEPTIGAMPIPEFHNQVMDLIQNKVPIEKANQAIFAHNEITDKPRAMKMASAVYQILGTGEKDKNKV